MLGRIVLLCEYGHGLTQCNGDGRCRDGSRPCRAAGLGVPWPLAGDDGATVSALGLDSSPPFLLSPLTRRGTLRIHSTTIAQAHACPWSAGLGCGQIGIRFIAARRRPVLQPLRLLFHDVSSSVPPWTAANSIVNNIHQHSLVQVVTHPFISRVMSTSSVLSGTRGSYYGWLRSRSPSLPHPPPVIMKSIFLIGSIGILTR